MSTPTVYANFKLKQNNGNAIDLSTAAIKVMIVTSTYTAAAATHAFKSDLTGEVSGTDLTSANIISVQALRSGSTAETMQVHMMRVTALN